MIGITAYGAYIPEWRIRKDLISRGLKGERSVASFDEDSLTMAVAASTNCLMGVDPKTIGGLFFASTTSPYKEKLVSSIIAAVLDLPKDVLTADFTNSLRSGTIALKAAMDAVASGSAQQILVVAADSRLGAPGSSFENSCGDGAAAFVIGREGVVARCEGHQAAYSGILDVWRADGDQFIRSGEERFVVSQGFLRVMPPTVAQLMKKKGLAAKDVHRAILYAPNSRLQRTLCSMLGLDPKSQLQDGLFDQVGNTGAAFIPMLLAAALDQARADEWLLAANYGDGCDACLFKSTNLIGPSRLCMSVQEQIQRKRMVPAYTTYLEWRGLLTKQRLSRPVMAPISVAALWRDQQHVLPFHGARCKKCGTVQYPPQRICTGCKAKDESELIRLSGKRGKVFTYSFDYLSSGLEPPPIVTAVFDFNDGGRALLMMTDRDLDEVKVGMPVEMTFRKYFSYDGIHNYVWKTMPLRNELPAGGKA